MSQTQAFKAITFFLLFLIQYTSSNSIGFSLKLIHMTIRKSPFYVRNLSEFEHIHQPMEMSKIRASNLSQENVRLHISHSSDIFLVEVPIGNPSKLVILLMDTGSSLTWTQCEPCLHCYKQSSPMYNSSASHSYKPLACHESICAGSPPPFRCENHRCVYTENYEDQSSTSGIAAQEHFGFLPNNILMSFGCSNNNTNAAFPDNKISGILGLGRSQESLVQQLGNVIGRRFSYCFPPLNAKPRATSYLRFGKDISTRGRKYQSTPFLNNQEFYHLSLRDISVNGRRLGFDPGTFSSGCVIDSGSTLSYIKENAFEDVINAFVGYFSRFTELKRYYSHPLYKLCYYEARGFHSYPSLTYHFENAEFTVDPPYVIEHTIFRRTKIFCITLLRDQTNQTLIGSWHQQNTRFIYDLDQRKLLFSREDCTKDAV